MTLRWKEFEKRVEERLRTEAATRPVLQKAWREDRSKRRNLADRPLLYFGAWCIAILPVRLWTSEGTLPPLTILAITWMGAFIAFAGKAHTTLFNATGQMLYASFPVSASGLFNLFAHKLRRTAAAFGFIAGAVYLTLYFLELIDFVTALGLAAAQTALCFAFAAHVLAYRTIRAWLVRALYGIILAGICAITHRVWNFPKSFPTEIWIILPPSWVHEFFFALTGRAGWIQFLWLAPCLIMVSLAPRSFRRVRANILAAYNFAPLAQYRSEKETPAEPDAETGRPELAAESPAAARWGKLGIAKTGFVDRLAAVILSPRQQLIAELLWTPSVNWTRRWKDLGIALTVAAPIILFLCSFDEDLFKPLMLLSALLLGPFLTFILECKPGLWDWKSKSTHKDGFPIDATLPHKVENPRQASDENVFPFEAMLPIGYGDVYWTSLKLNCLRIAAAVPLWIAFAGGVAWIAFGHPGAGLIFAGKFLLFITAAQLSTVPLWISVSPAKSHWIFDFLLVVAYFSTLLLIFGGLAALFMLSDQAALPIIAATAFFGYVSGSYQRWMYCSGRL
jgi:hypothetical protein